MARRKNQVKGLMVSNDEKKTKKKVTQFNIKMYVLALFATGLNFVPTQKFLALNNVVPPTERDYYSAQPEVIRTILDFARDEVYSHFTEISADGVVAIDGSWSTRRNAAFCIVDVICVATKKIVDFEIVNKKAKGLVANYDGPSNQMEAEGFRRMIPRLIKNANIKYEVIDGDVKLEKLITAANWSVTIVRDYTHKLKNLKTIFDKYNSECGGKLKGLWTRLECYLKQVLFDDATPVAEKVERWANCVAHYTGDHTHCDHKLIVPYAWKSKGCSAAVDALQGFVDEVKVIVAGFRRGWTTNYNENFHSLKGVMVPKIINWGASWTGRVACAVLQYNCPESWILQILRLWKIGHLGAACTKILYDLWERQSRRNTKKNSQAERKKRNATKARERDKAKKSNGDLAHK